MQTPHPLRRRVSIALAALRDTLNAPSHRTGKLMGILRKRAARPYLAALVAGGVALSAAAVSPDVPDWHGFRTGLAGLTARLGFGPANAQPRPSLAPIKAVIAQPVEAPPVQALRDLTPEQAVAWNAAIPISTLLNRPAAPFHLPTGSSVDGQRALDCLTATIYYEAGNESPEGQRAVAQVMLNRLRHPAYPKTVCGVAFQGAELPTGCQFTYTCDGALARVPSAEGWNRARKVAAAALAGYVEASVGGATHYHTVWVVPYWQGEVAKVKTIGAHIFYRWDGGWANPRYALGYAGDEPDVAKIYGVGAAPFATPHIQLAVLEAPVAAPAPAPVEIVKVAAADHDAILPLETHSETLPPMQVAPLSNNVEKAIPVAVGEVRKNRQVPLPGGW